MKKWACCFGLILTSVCLFGCGGGGGGSEPFYAGVWRYTGYKLIDDCNLGLDPQVSFVLTVNQDGERVVLQSGQVTMEGAVNDEDGFLVTNVSTASNGCQLATAYAFKDASDGEADVGLAMIARCGTQECKAGYAGTAFRDNGRGYGAAASAETFDALVRQFLSGLGLEAMPKLELEGDGDAALRDDAEAAAKELME